MNLKQYNPVKVKDPSSDGYAIRLHPRQSFQLILTQIFEDEIFDVELKSDYLVLEEFVSDKENSKEIYCFSQKYDLERWSKISTTFLGNLIVTISPTEKGKKETEIIRLCVYLNCSDASKAHVVTVIDPDQHLLKIDSNQIVHVVMSDEHKARWTLVGIEELGMDCARSETVFNDVSNVYDPQALFCPEPRIIPMPINPALDNAHNSVALSELNRDTKCGGKEYHFFTHLSLTALKKAHSSSNGNYPMGDMNFVCKISEGVSTDRSLTLLMALRGTGKRISTAEFQAIRHNTRNWNTPFASSVRQCVLSPGFNESIDLPVDADTLYIEIPQPSVYYSQQMDDAYWSSEINLDVKFGLKVKELKSRHVNGFMVQRFMVVGILATRPPGELLFIGALRFACRNSKGAVYSLKSISLSLWKVKSASSDRRSTAAYNYTCVPNSIVKTKYRQPEKQQTVKYEVELEQMAPGLIDLKCVSLHEIDGTIRSRFSFSDYDFEDLMYPSERKKKATTGSINYARHPWR